MGGILRIPSEGDDQSKDRRKVPRASNKTKKNSIAKGNSCDDESCCTVITTIDRKSTAKCNKALLMDTPLNTAK